jgi:BirA family transcriptional regulator, biotin operon repressor / biotin---[acetyl-CoA-carboxylase] ligase
VSSVAADSLAREAVEPYLGGRFGTPYLYEASCESTQLLLLGSGLREGAIAVAEHQSSGRGRLGRSWSAPPESSILVSILLEPPAERTLPQLSLVAALAAAEAVEAATGLAAQIKWPNDVMLNRRKVGGIISEVTDGTVVVGIGLNVNQTRDQLPLAAPTEPGSLRSLTGEGYDRAALLGSLLARLESAYDVWCEHGLDGVYGELGARDFLRGRRVTVDGEPATVVQIARDGRLEVATDAHEIRAIESGEISFRA